VFVPDNELSVDQKLLDPVPLPPRRRHHHHHHHHHICLFKGSKEQW